MMLFYAIIAKAILMLIFVAGVRAESPSTVGPDGCGFQTTAGHLQRFEHLSTAAIHEPAGTPKCTCSRRRVPRTVRTGRGSPRGPAGNGPDRRLRPPTGRS